VFHNDEIPKKFPQVLRHIFVETKKVVIINSANDFEFFGRYLGRILEDTIYPDADCSWTSTFLQANEKIFRKTDIGTVSKIFPKISFIITIQCKQCQVFPAVKTANLNYL
jgi:hypothetical protein